MAFRGISVFLSACAVAWAGDGSADAVRHAYTVGVDGRTGQLVRVPLTRTVTARAVPSRPAPEKSVEAREAEPAENVAPAYSRDWISDLAYSYGIRPSFVHAVIKAESNYNPRAISPKGALGLMQLMPQTARRYGVKNVLSPAENVEGGLRYLRHLLDLYESKPALTLAAYNAGEGAVDRYRGVPPYAETRQYVQRVNKYYSRYLALEKPPAPLPAPKKWDGPQIYQSTDASGLTHYTTNTQ